MPLWIGQEVQEMSWRAVLAPPKEQAQECKPKLALLIRHHQIDDSPLL